MVQIQPTRDHAPVLEIPPTGVTGVGGWFRSNLHATTHRFLNPTHGSYGSAWMVQIQPTYEHAPVLEIPPTGVGGWFRSNLHTSTHRVLESHPREWVDGSDPTYIRARTAFLNPTHGSGWMVQIQPTREHAPRS